MTFSSYTTQSVDDIVEALKTSKEYGLSSDEARIRLVQYGAHAIRHQTATWIDIFNRQWRSSFIYLLIGAAALSFFLGQSIDALLIVLFVLINVGLGFYQEQSSQKTLALLSSYISPKTCVLRDGSRIEISTHAIVPGDIIPFQAGDMIPSDIRVIEQSDALLDESSLTGESQSVRKQSAPLSKEAHQIFEAANICFEGTTVMRGSGSGIVIATGSHTAFGAIAHAALNGVRHTSFERELSTFSSFILRLVVITLVALFIVNVWLKGGETSLGELIIFSIALAVSVIPEALPLVVTFCLAKGAHKLARQKVVVKRLSAVEDLGAIDVLCTDKTGTLTENVLTVANTFAHKKGDPLFLAGLAIPHLSQDKQRLDPFDGAIQHAMPSEKRMEAMKYREQLSIPFDPVRRRNTALVVFSRFATLISRGAFEDIAELCKGFSKQDRESCEQWIALEGKHGRRVLAVASKRMTAKPVGSIASHEHGMQFGGLISFGDPLKKTTKDAVFNARNLGIKVKILTGDSSAVAGSVARAIGLITSDEEVMTGTDFDALSESARLQAVETRSVFARVTPDHKLRIIQLLQQTHTVGFLGEGINDAPALKIANVAIVVQGCSDIAREASDIVLLQKSLAVIVDGISEGRIVFGNTLKYIRATLASNFGNFYAVAVASLFIPYLPMLPLQILLVNLLSDFPMIAIATDSVDDREIKQPAGHHIRDILLIATLLGIVSTIFDFIVFAVFRSSEPSVLQTNWFMASILTELVFIFSIRTRRFFLKGSMPSFSLLFFSVLAGALTILLPYTSFGQSVFSFHPPAANHLALIAGIVIVYFAVSESVKLMYYRHFTHG